MIDLLGAIMRRLRRTETAPVALAPGLHLEWAITPAGLYPVRLRRPLLAQEFTTPPDPLPPAGEIVCFPAWLAFQVVSLEWGWPVWEVRE